MPPISETGRGVESRHAAWRILLEQESSGAFLKDLFGARLRGFSPEDSDLIRTICLGVVRWKRLLDYNLDLQARRGIKDKRLRMLLRVAAQQMLVLTGVPAFAAVNTAVEIAKREFGKSEAGFANAMLKGVSRSGLRRHPGTDAEARAVNASHPTWLVERWSRALSPALLEGALRRNNEEAPLWIRVNPRKPGNTVAALRAEGVELDPAAAAPMFFQVKQGADKAFRSAAFSGGGFSFQDPVAYWIARLLDWHPGQTILDACSAPGGKSALLLEWAASRGEDLGPARIVCADVSFSRLRRIRDARDRLGHGELSPLCSDLVAPAFQGRFERILLDAPCSNLGVLRRRPEARWNLTPEKIGALSARQRRLLEKAADLLAPGGRLVYAVCSAEGEETADVIDAFLSAHPDFALDEAQGVPEPLRKRGCLWVYPGESEYDGFFAAALVKRAAV